MKNLQNLKNISFAVFGLLLILIPGKLFGMAVIILGILSIYTGIIVIVTERKLLDDLRYKKIVQIRGITSIIVGLFAAVCPIAIGGSIWTFTCITMGIWILISGIMEFIASIQLSRNEIDAKGLLIESIVSVIIAIILFALASSEGRNTFLRIIGAIMFLSSIVFFLTGEKFHKSIDPEYVEAENIETIDTVDSSKN